MSLSNLTIAVTGAASGIGRAFALAYGAEGANVVVADRDLGGAEAVRGEIAAAGGRALAVEVDVTDRRAVRAGLAAARARFGRLDVMCNNAGISQSGPFLETTADEWMRQLRVNGLGTLIGMQESARVFIEQGGGGRIINTTSVAARRSSATFPAYAASKAAVSSLIQSGARALAEHDITVMGLAPGIVDTNLWSGLSADAAERAKRLEAYSAGIVRGRVSTPDDLVGTAVFLASPASEYLTGQVIMADGGMVLV